MSDETTIPAPIPTLPRDRLPGKQEQAASLMAEGRLPDKRIAAELKVTPQTIWNWKQTIPFQVAVAEYKDAFRQRILSEGIARLEVRVAAQNQRHQEIEEIIRQRALAYDGPDIPGGNTGHMVRQVKFVKVLELRHAVQAQLNAGNITEEDLTDADYVVTKQTRPVEEYAADTALLAELRQIEKHTAQELGQWIERSDQHVNFDVTEASDEELEAITQG